jgi:hypothetical protein
LERAGYAAGRDVMIIISMFREAAAARRVSLSEARNVLVIIFRRVPESDGVSVVGRSDWSAKDVFVFRE